MKSLFNFLYKLGVIDNNPFTNLKVSKASLQEYRRRILSIGDLYAVYRTARILEERGNKFLGPTLLAMYTGLRVTSLNDLKFESVNFQKQTLSYSQTKYRSKDKSYELPLPTELLGLIKSKASSFNTEDSLLSGLYGGPITNKQMQHIINIICIN